MSELVNDATPRMIYDGAEVPLVISADKLSCYVLYNLLHNAAKFTSEGVITVHTDKVDSHCVIRSKGYGKGIKPGITFASFYPVSSKENPVFTGSGLGSRQCAYRMRRWAALLTLNHFVYRRWVYPEDRVGVKGAVCFFPWTHFLYGTYKKIPTTLMERYGGIANKTYLLTSVTWITTVKMRWSRCASCANMTIRLHILIRELILIRYLRNRH